jgi:hypothetical protein
MFASRETPPVFFSRNDMPNVTETTRERLSMRLRLCERGETVSCVAHGRVVMVDAFERFVFETFEA